MSSDPLVDIQHVVSHSFKVTTAQPGCAWLPGGVVGGGDKAAVLLSVGDGFEGVGDVVESLEDVAEQVDRGRQLLLRLVGLDGGGGDGDVDALGADGVVEGDAGDVDVCA